MTGISNDIKNPILEMYSADKARSMTEKAGADLIV